MDEFGQDTVRNVPVVLPTPEFFPDHWDGTPENAQLFLKRVCGYMQVEPARVDLHLYREEDVGEKMKDLLPHWEQSGAGAAGLYSESSDQENLAITIKLGPRIDLVSVIAIMAHELGHVLLLGDGRLDHEAWIHSRI